MGYGLQVSNASGYVQIDQDFSNYYVAQTGTATTDTAWNGSNAATVVNIPSFLTRPLIFVRPLTYGICLMVRWNTPENSFAVAGFNYQGGGINAAYEYVVMGRSMEGAVSDAYGLNVWDASGRLSFSSRERALKILTSLNYADLQNTKTLTVGPSSAKRYLYLGPCNVSQWILNENNPNISHTISVVGRMTSNDSVSFLEAEVGSGPPATFTFYGTRTMMLTEI